MKGIEAAFIGTLSKDPELKQGKNGKPYCNFGCAIANEGNDPSWVNVITFGEMTENLVKAAHKGDKVYCEGHLSLATWLHNEGKPRSGLAVNAWKVERLANIGKNRLPQGELPLALPAKKKRKHGFGLFRKPEPKSSEIDPEFNDEMPF